MEGGRKARVDAAQAGGRTASGDDARGNGLDISPLQLNKTYNLTSNNNLEGEVYQHFTSSRCLYTPAPNYRFSLSGGFTIRPRLVAYCSAGLALEGLDGSSGGRARWVGRSWKWQLLLSWWALRFRPRLMLHPMARPVHSWSAGAKVLTVTAVFLVSAIHNVGSWSTVWLDYHSRRPFVVARMRLHSDFLSGLQGNSRITCSVEVMVEFLHALALVQQALDFQGVIGCWCK